VFERVENFYLNFFRNTLILIATLTIIFGLINFIISVTKISDTPNLRHIDLPSWSEIKFDVLPISKPNTSKNKKETQSKQVIEKLLETNIDRRILITFNNINELFISESSNGSNYYTLVAFNEWVENAPINNRYKNQFLDGLIIFSEEIMKEQRMRKIRNLENRAQIIFESLDRYLEIFLLEIQIKDINNQELINESLNKNNSGYIQLANTGYALAAFIFVLLLILIFKIEVNLREISPAINKKK
jgi:hypothetical protein